MNNTWSCRFCGYQYEERPERWCKNCGLVQAGPATHQKYQILEEYCHPLSLIMRKRGFEHYFIDACAGSGYHKHRVYKDWNLLN